MLQHGKRWLCRAAAAEWSQVDDHVSYEPVMRQSALHGQAAGLGDDKDEPRLLQGGVWNFQVLPECRVAAASAGRVELKVQLEPHGFNIHRR
jgi:hypothetical protein